MYDPHSGIIDGISWSMAELFGSYWWHLLARFVSVFLLIIETAACGCQLRWSVLLMRSKWCPASRRLSLTSALIRRRVTSCVTLKRGASAIRVCKLPLICHTRMHLWPLRTMKSLWGGYANSTTYVTIAFIFMLSQPDSFCKGIVYSVSKYIMFPGCSIVSYVCPFVWSDIVATICHKWPERFWYNW